MNRTSEKRQQLVRLNLERLAAKRRLPRIKFLVTYHETSLGKHVDISFSEAKIRDLCCCRNALVQVYGLELAKKICNRLALLAAASAVSDLPSSPPISLAVVDGTGVYSVALGHTHRLFFEAITPNSRRANAPSKPEIQIIGPVPVPAAKGKRS